MGFADEKHIRALSTHEDVNSVTINMDENMPDLGWLIALKESRRNQYRTP
jgi:hypothetical protein